jgi:hypothetical protein
MAATPIPDVCSLRWLCMAQTISSQQDMAAKPRLARRVGVISAAGGAAAGAALVLAAVVLWFQYGTTVFFEMVASGFVACF